MVEMSYLFTFDEDQDMETKPIYLSGDKNENTTPCSTPGNLLPNNVPDSYETILQLN